jgi:hypothetical protein
MGLQPDKLKQELDWPSTLGSHKPSGRVLRRLSLRNMEGKGRRKKGEEEGRKGREGKEEGGERRTGPFSDRTCLQYNSSGDPQFAWMYKCLVH